MGIEEPEELVEVPIAGELTEAEPVESTESDDNRPLKRLSRSLDVSLNVSDNAYLGSILTQIRSISPAQLGYSPTRRLKFPTYRQQQ